MRESRIVRLGQGVDATGRLADEALVRAFAAIDEYAAMVAAARRWTRMRFCATSATRDSSNAAEFAAGGARPARRLARGAVRVTRRRRWPRRRDPQPAHAADTSRAGHRHRRRVDRADARRLVQPGLGAVDGHRLGADARAVPHRRPAHARAGGGLRRRRSTPQLDACPVPTAEAATVVGVAGHGALDRGRRARPAVVRQERDRPVGGRGRRRARLRRPAGGDAGGASVWSSRGCTRAASTCSAPAD